MAFDSAKGLLFLHTRSPPIIHRDFKSANVLVDAQWHAKVADFNMSRALEEQGVLSTLCVTNPRWLSPELLRGLQATLASDVYAMGVVLWELSTWKLPWGDSTNPFMVRQAGAGGGGGAGGGPRQRAARQRCRLC